MATFIAVYGTISILAAVIAGIVAGVKRRDYSYWAAVSFIFPPLLIALLLMPKNTGPRPVRESLDHDDRYRE